MKIFEVIDDLVIEAFSIHEIEEPQVHIKIEDDCDTLLILFAKEIRPLIAALTEAAVWLANEATKVNFLWRTSSQNRYIAILKRLL